MVTNSTEILRNNVRRLARSRGIPVKSLPCPDFLSGNCGATLRTLDRLAEFFRVHPWTLLTRNAGGLLPEESAEVMVEAIEPFWECRDEED
jgi:hypothetical protein